MILWGVLNVTPDSFSDGGQFPETRAAVDRGLQMIDEGADVIDVGGESTRPGAEPVGAEEEIRRVLPVISALVGTGAKISVDTSKAAVARAALNEGATIVNDVTAWRDPAMPGLCAEAGCEVCLMHMRGEPRTMQADPKYEDVVVEVRDYLVDQASKAEAIGIPRERIWIDPGIGFGKTVDQNLALIRSIPVLVDTGYPVLIGVSRKSFIGRLLGDVPTSERLEGTLAAQVLAQASGASAIRAHDVKAARRAMTIASAILKTVG